MKHLLKIAAIVSLMAGVTPPAMAQPTGVEALHVVVRTFFYSNDPGHNRSILLHDVYPYTSLSLTAGQAQCENDKAELQAVYANVPYTVEQAIFCGEAKFEDLR